jgi:hypothetical protein
LTAFTLHRQHNMTPLLMPGAYFSQGNIDQQLSTVSLTFHDLHKDFIGKAGITATTMPSL